MINFVLASIGVGVVTAVINAAIRKELGVLITILNFGVRQIALLFVVSIVVAALASFLPVKKIASKKPIDAIRNR
jgi:ABC-type lipoprotein release transport system permease subunit